MLYSKLVPSSSYQRLVAAMTVPANRRDTHITASSTGSNDDSSAVAHNDVATLEQTAQPAVVSDQILHKRYLTLYNRTVQFPGTNGSAQGPLLEYDVVGHSKSDFHFTVVFPYHPADDSVTLIREYAQGLNQMVWCLPSGGYDPHKHSSYEACARAELSEEAALTGGTWTPLLPEQHPGIAEVKWCRNRFHSYLCWDPHPDPQPGRRDAEEFNMEVQRVSVDTLRHIMLSGDMLLPSVTTCFIALERLALDRQRQQQAPR